MLLFCVKLIVVKLLRVVVGCNSLVGLNVLQFILINLFSSVLDTVNELNVGLSASR